MRFLSIPGRRHENRYFQLMLEALEASGAEIVDPRLVHLATFRYDILCLNFPVHYVTESSMLGALAYSFAFGAYLLVARLLGRKIVYIVHDVEPMKPRNEFILWRFLDFVHSLTQGYVFISKSSCDAFISAHPEQQRKPRVLIPHGPYPTTRLTPAKRSTLRRSLVGDEDVFLLGYLGRIKPYKNPAALQAIPPTLRDGRKIRTVIAGKIEAEFEPQIKAVFDALPPENVIRLDQALGDAELDELIQTVDAVLMPYLRGSNSGIALLVLANEGRLIGSDLPVLRELADNVGAPWVSIACSEQALPEAVLQAAVCTIGDFERKTLRDYLEQNGFEAGGRVLHAFCRRLLSPTDRIEEHQSAA